MSQFGHLFLHSHEFCIRIMLSNTLCSPILQLMFSPARPRLSHVNVCFLLARKQPPITALVLVAKNLSSFKCSNLPGMLTSPTSLHPTNKMKKLSTSQHMRSCLPRMSRKPQLIAIFALTMTMFSLNLDSLYYPLYHFLTSEITY